MRHRLLLSAVLLGLNFSAALPSSAQTPPATAGDTSAATPATSGDAAAGEEIYGSTCRACHGGAIAPSLRGVAGRPIASVAEYGNYSEGLKAKKDQTWTDANLSTYLTAPTDFAAGGTMTFSVPDEKQRADIIAFLKTFTP